MDEVEAIKELAKSGKQAADGNWIPLTVVVIALGVIFFLAMVIVRMVLNTQNKRIKEAEEKQKDTDVLLDKMSDNLIEVKAVTTRLDTIISYHENDIKRNEKDIKRNDDRIHKLLE